MERDDFIIMVFCLVAEELKILRQSHPIRRGGFAPALTDEEVITLELCGEYFKLSTDKDIYNYFKAHYQSWFPALGERTSFVRQAANLWLFKALMWQQIVRRAEQFSAPVQVIDTLPIPVCKWVRGVRDKCFAGFGEYGYCAAKQEHYYGFKLGLRVSPCGMITSAMLLPARAHDVNHTETLADGCTQTILADKGFIDPFRQILLEERYGTRRVVPNRKNMKQSVPTELDKIQTKAARKIRKVVETVNSHLTERLNLAKIRVPDLWHFQSRVIRKVLTHTILVFINLQLKRKPLDLDGLVLN